jgi:K+-transporting ATPase ATPase A chain
MVRKQRVPASLGTLPTHTPLFVVVLAGTVILVGALTFFPSLALGPIVEQVLMGAGHILTLSVDRSRGTPTPGA